MFKQQSILACVTSITLGFTLSSGGAWAGEITQDCVDSIAAGVAATLPGGGVAQADGSHKPFRIVLTDELPIIDVEEMDIDLWFYGSDTAPIPVTATLPAQYEGCLDDAAVVTVYEPNLKAANKFDTDELANELLPYSECTPGLQAWLSHILHHEALHGAGACGNATNSCIHIAININGYNRGCSQASGLKSCAESELLGPDDLCPDITPPISKGGAGKKLSEMCKTLSKAHKKFTKPQAQQKAAECACGDAVPATCLPAIPAPGGQCPAPAPPYPSSYPVAECSACQSDD